MLSELHSLNLQLYSKLYNKTFGVHLFVVPQLSSDWRHNYSSKTRQAGSTNEQSMYSLLSMPYSQHWDCFNQRRSKSYFFLQSQWFQSYQQFSNFSIDKSCKTYPRIILPPCGKNWQLICPNSFSALLMNGPNKLECNIGPRVQRISRDKHKLAYRVHL